MIVLCFLASPVFGQDQTCPEGMDQSADKAALFDQLEHAPDAAVANAVMDQLWQIWTLAPDAKAQDILDRGMSARESYDFLGSRDILDELVEYCPTYAEGYNQRAFASFLRQDYAAALVDLDSALGLDPKHLGALSGKALTLMGMGRSDEAQVILRQAVALNPWLKERGMILPPKGQDI